MKLRVSTKYLGGCFYLLAGLYLLISKPLDAITILAISACVSLAIISIEFTDWAAIGGGVLIAGSLLLQSILSYRCVDCIRADLIILVGVIILTIKEKGNQRKLLGALSTALTAFMIFTLSMNYNPKVVFSKSVVVEEFDSGDCGATTK